MWLAASSRQAKSLPVSRDCSEGAIDAGKQFSAADRLLDEVGRARLHGLHCNRDIAVAGDHDGRQAVARLVAAAAAKLVRSCREDTHRSPGRPPARDERPPGTPRSYHNPLLLYRRLPARRGSPHEYCHRRQRRISRVVCCHRGFLRGGSHAPERRPATMVTDVGSPASTPSALQAC